MNSSAPVSPGDSRVARHQSLELYGSPELGVSEQVSEQLHEIARLAKLFTDTDGAIVQVLPAGRQVVLGMTQGASPAVLPESDSICARLLEQRPLGTVVIENLAADPRFAHNRYVDGRSGAVRGWASSPLIGAERVAIGTLCVFSRTPRTYGRDEASLLDQFARAAVKVLDDARRAHRGESHPSGSVARVARVA